MTIINFMVLVEYNVLVQMMIISRKVNSEIRNSTVLVDKFVLCKMERKKPISVGLKTVSHVVKVKD